METGEGVGTIGKRGMVVVTACFYGSRDEGKVLQLKGKNCREN